jgi:hypothetical protein
MPVVKTALVTFLGLLLVSPSFSDDKEYTCGDLPSLLENIKRRSDSASVSATLIKFMGRTSNCFLQAFS